MESCDGYRDISSPLVVGESSIFHADLGVCGPWPGESTGPVGKGPKESGYSLGALPWNKAWDKYCEPSPLLVQTAPLLLPWIDSVW